MFLPFTIWAKDIPEITDAELEAKTQCMCGNECKVRESLAVWTHTIGQDNYHWFAACQPSCITRNVIIGNC